MTRVLKKYTTIPQDLYVERKADKQLASIIEDMQRPGYVLVARQMGKTNLLFNAKRQLENDKRLFAYVDMSNVFKKERECYQNIIDCIIEPNSDAFFTVENNITSIRSHKLPPHKEYMRSLRVLLNHFDGDMVIILDEIDALKTAEYSDNIFAQIRSNYFTRTVFPEFEHLTYVLSGVIEPTELIKDRNKSPFNIGDKIYLDDFNEEEHQSFLNKSGLNLSTEISEHIFSWVNGNPRLTFDIFSEVESFLIKNSAILISDVDNIIKNKYLTNFDIAPIDHIRELVKDNIEVIKSLISMHDGSFGELNDELKRKLYLYGITNSTFSNSPSFKNRVIRESLSLDWLKNVKNHLLSKSLTITHALAEFDLGKYADTIEILKAILEDNSNTKDIEIIKYFLGFSYNKIGNYERSLEHLSYNFNDKIYKSRSVFLTGICQIQLGKEKEGIENLRTLIDNEDDFSKHNAILNLARMEGNDYDEKLELFRKLFESASNSIDGANYNPFYCFASLYFQSEIYREKEKLDDAITMIENAFKYANVSEKYFLKYHLARLRNNSIEEHEETVNYIISNRLNFDTVSNELELGFNRSTLSSFVNCIYGKIDNNLFVELYSYMQQNVFKSPESLHSFLYESSLINNFNCGLLLFLVHLKENISEDLLLKIYTDLSIYHINDRVLFTSYFDNFSKLENKDDNFTEARMYIYLNYIKMLYDKSQFDKMLHTISYVESNIIEYPKDELLNLSNAHFQFWKGVVFNRIGHNSASYDSFKKCSDIIKNSSYSSTTFLNEQSFNDINNFELKLKPKNYLAYDYLKKMKFTKPAKSYTKKQIITVRYLNDGMIKSGKYKSFINDINSLKCEIIDD